MKRVAVIVFALVAALVGVAPPATASKNDRIDWGVANWAAGVQMYVSDPSQSDPQIHVKFKRTGGEGQRQVRMGERHKVPGSHRWTPYAYARTVKLQVGQKVVFTTERALPCEPAKEPLGITVEMRVKKPGKPWGDWTIWVSEDHFLLEC